MYRNTNICYVSYTYRSRVNRREREQYTKPNGIEKNTFNNNWSETYFCSYQGSRTFTFGEWDQVQINLQASCVFDFKVYTCEKKG